jgi:hypothetical protein
VVFDAPQASLPVPDVTRVVHLAEAAQRGGRGTRQVYAFMFTLPVSAAGCVSGRQPARPARRFAGRTQRGVSWVLAGTGRQVDHQRVLPDLGYPHPGVEGPSHGGVL